MTNLWDFLLEHLIKVIVAATVIFLAVVITLLIINGRHVSGTVVGKDYQPMQVIPMTQCPTSNTCVVTQTIIPESWNLTVAPDDGSGNVTRSVDPTYWEQVAVGDRWTDN